MAYNGVGLSTARGSGTNGYIQRNAGALNVRKGPPGGTAAGYQRYEDYLNEIAKPPVHRNPDQGILEHERKRQVEIKCIELQDRLEDEGLDDDEIQEHVAALRTKLQAAGVAIPGRRATDSHSIAAAKEAEMGRMRGALRISADHVEGKAFIRETDEERAARMAERELKERAKIEAALKREEEEEKRKKEWEEKEKLRRREEYMRKREAERGDRRRMKARDDSRSPPPRRRRDDSDSPPPRSRRRDDSLSPPPPRRRDDSPPPRRRGESPPPRGRDASLSRSPPPRRRVDSRSPPPRARDDSRSPPPRGRDDSRSPPPRRRDSRSPVSADSRSPSPPPRSRKRYDDSRSPSPPPRRRDSSTPPRRRRYSDSD